MFGLGLPEILIIAFLFLFLFGARRLPDIGAGLGKTLKEIRKIRGEGKDEKKRAEEVVSDLKKEVEEIPGLKEAKEIKETADKIKQISKLLK